jgi:hypothetical protein
VSSDTAKQRLLRNHLDALADALDREGRTNAPITLTPEQFAGAGVSLRNVCPEGWPLAWRSHPLLGRPRRSRCRP